MASHPTEAAHLKDVCCVVLIVLPFWGSLYTCREELNPRCLGKLVGEVLVMYIRCNCTCTNVCINELACTCTTVGTCINELACTCTVYTHVQATHLPFFPPLLFSSTHCDSVHQASPE